MQKKKQQSLGEEIANAITHGIAFFLAIAALVLLLVKSDSGMKILSVTIFGIGLMLVYINSCLYHCFRHNSKVKKLWKRFDHASIYILIASTFAPFLLVAMQDKNGWIYFILQWTVTLSGVTFKCIWPKKYHILHICLFLLLGWSGIFLFPVLKTISWSLTMLTLFGGILYSIGVIFYAFSKVKYFHMIWHFFVIGGSILHFFAIYLYIL